MDGSLHMVLSGDHLLVRPLVASDDAPMLTRTGLAHFDAADALIEMNAKERQRSHHSHRNRHHRSEIRLRLGQCGGQEKDSNTRVLYTRLYGDS